MKRLKQFFIVMFAVSAVISTTLVSCDNPNDPSLDDSTSDIVWRGDSDDIYYDVISVPDGVVAVGKTASNDSWSYNAVIAKYDNNGNIVWKNYAGNYREDAFISVTATSDGFVAVGHSLYGHGYDLLPGAGFAYVATIVKYDNSGNLIWAKGAECGPFSSVIAVSDGIIAVRGGWGGITKFDNNGNVIWEKPELIGYTTAIKVSDGIVALDCYDTIIKLDNNCNVVWKTHTNTLLFGDDYHLYFSITAVSDGFIAVGSYGDSFADADWRCRNGIWDAIIVKYDNNGNVIWGKNFGGSAGDAYYSATATVNGIIVIGQSNYGSFGNGDWTGVAAKSNEYSGFGNDFIIVKYDNAGNVVWKNNFDGDTNWGGSLAAVSDGIVVVGGFGLGREGPNIVKYKIPD